MATRSVRARYRNGVLEPLEAVDLSEDQEVLLTLDDEQQAPSDQDSLSKSAGVWADMFEDPEQFIKDVYQARIDGTRPPRHL
ncbi:MAG: DUF104 domain-containing protein [Chloroflexi bacterium]|nr:DUF104 domain-containing protein [Chloroflexota bacterium]